jgi:glycosyltransferase involved in cell wall biosynthesis
LDSKQTLILVGKAPPPYYGTSVWYEIILNSTMDKYYNLAFYDSSIHNAISSVSKVKCKTPFKNFWKIVRYCFFLRKMPIGVCHIPISQTVGGMLRDYMYVLISLIAGHKVLLHLHGSALEAVYANAIRPVRKIVRSINRHVSGGIVLSKRFREVWRTVGVERVYVVRNGANYVFPIERKHDRGWSLLYLSNLQESKGIYDVVHAMAYINKTAPEVRLDVVGSWRDEQTEKKIKRVVKEKDLNVVFHGPKYAEDKFQFYADASAFVFTPRRPEGHPWVINEALAASLPIVATPMGMIADAVRDAYNGYLVDVSDVEAIAKSILHIYSDEALRLSMGRRSREIYEQHYTEETMIEDLRLAVDSATGKVREGE